MNQYFLLPLVMLLNRARGSDMFGLTTYTVSSRLIATFFMSFIALSIIGTTIPVFIVVWCGLMFWSSFGWGKYFSAFHGKDTPEETEIKWIDKLGYFVFPSNDNVWRNRFRGMLCMSIRGGVFAYPMYIGMALTGYPTALLTGLLMFFQGLAYFSGALGKEQYGALQGELLTGALLYLSWIFI